MKLSESLSFDVYNMHAKAGKWVFRAPECSLKRGVYGWTDIERIFFGSIFTHSLFNKDKDKKIIYLFLTQPETENFQTNKQISASVAFIFSTTWHLRK